MSAPVKHTCPDIDKAIKWINEARKISWDGKSEFPEACDSFRDIYDYIDDIGDILEDLRKSNDALRKWGEGLEDEIQILGEEINKMNTNIK